MEEYRPKARTVKLVVQQLEDEVLVYDLERSVAHCLNGSAARVWTLCEGEKTVSQIAEQVAGDLETEEAESLVWHALEQFTKRHLLDEATESDQAKAMTRRQVVMRLGLVAAMIPVVDSIVAPPAAWAQSGPTGPTGPTGPEE